MVDHPSVTPGVPLRNPKQPKIPLKQPYFDQQSFLGKEGNCPLNTINWKVFLIFTTPLPSFGGASLIHHPIGPSQSPKATKSTTQTIRFGSAIFFGQRPQQGTKSCRMSVCPSVHPSVLLSLHPSPPLRLLSGPQAPLAGPQATLKGPQTPLTGPLSPFGSPSDRPLDPSDRPSRLSDRPSEPSNQA